MLIYYTETILILYLTDIFVLTDIPIAKKNKIQSAILYYFYNISILNLYIADSFSDRFISVNNKSQCNYFSIYTEIILNLYLADTVAAKTIATSTAKKDKD